MFAARVQVQKSTKKSSYGLYTPGVRVGAYIVMAYIVVPYIVAACIVAGVLGPYKVMAQVSGPNGQSTCCPSLLRKQSITVVVVNSWGQAY